MRNSVSYTTISSSQNWNESRGRGFKIWINKIIQPQYHQMAHLLEYTWAFEVDYMGWAWFPLPVHMTTSVGLF